MCLEMLLGRETSVVHRSVAIVRWCTQRNALLVERAAEKKEGTEREGTANAGAPVLGTAGRDWPDKVEHRAQKRVKLEHSWAAADCRP